MIFNDHPNDWRELQNNVGQLFMELGCEVEVEKVVNLVRGSKEIDVFVQDIAITPALCYLCECKYWKTPITQDVIHSFRTVVSDFGANKGYIISKTGFQSGSFEAVKNTNIQLVTFQELQEIFFDRWLSSMVKKFMPYADRLFPYWDYTGGKMPRTKWTSKDRDTQELLIKAYEPLVDLGPSDIHHGFNRKFPIKVPTLNEDFEVIEEITIRNARDYFDFININKDKALLHFQKLYGEI